MTVSELRRRMRMIDRELAGLCPFRTRASELHAERRRVVVELERLREDCEKSRPTPDGGPEAA